MNRNVAAMLCLLIILQSGGAAFAAEGASGGLDVGGFFKSIGRVVATVVFSQPGIRPAPGVPRRAMPDYTDPRRYARLIPKPDVPVRVEMAPRPIDLVKLEREQQLKVAEVPGSTQLVSRTRMAPRFRHQGRLSLAAPTTGVWPWWTYEARAVPGLGQAMANVANLNLLMEADDVDVPEGGLALAFRRVYNSQSSHDAAGDDGSTPSVYGNGWTNTLDIHLGWYQPGSNTGTVSVYTADGARDDYICQINEVAVCTSKTPGVYDTLATTQLTGGIACELQWTKKSGTSYIFDAPYSACTANKAGYYGRLLAIYARNSYWSVQLSYGWGGNGAGNPENLAKIVATHEPDGAQMTLAFGQTQGSNPVTELMSITRPDQRVIDYQYDASGNLTGVDKPGNNPVLQTAETPPTQWPNGVMIPLGNLPELYDISKKLINQACGPRGAITSLRSNTGNSKADGACINFDYNSQQLADWYPMGVLDPTPRDNVSPSPIQPNETGWQQWGATSFIQFIASSCNGTISQLSDQLGHTVQWCFDNNERVIQTYANVVNTTWLMTAQSWDSNNDLTTTTDARGNATQMAYDPNGNIVEVSLPSQATSIGSIRPTSFYDYDSYNNVIRYCDPANNSNNSWVSSTSDTLCKKYGTNYATYTYSSDPNQSSDPNELYGCVIFDSTALGYQTTFYYSGANGGPCGEGLPTKVQATASFGQADGQSRQPTQKFSYNANGTLNTYDAGNGQSQLGYTSNGMNRLRSRQDPDGVTSYWCYNLDGSTFYSETQLQHNLDGSAGCPTDAALASGTATPAPYAVDYGYDPDHNVATKTERHNCGAFGNGSGSGGGNCAANTPVGSWCTPSVSIAAGTTCNYYDGLDRLVEVKQPYDLAYDIYTNPWITRDLYDLTGGKVGYGGQSFSAYGNLYETQELLAPGGATITLTKPYVPGDPSPPPNTTYEAVKAAAFDGLDRTVAKYSMVNSHGLNTEALTWDTSPLDPNVQGLLGEDCNNDNQCQEFDYTPDGEKLSFAASGSNPAPSRSYVYDPDGRPTKITSAAYSNPQKYTYDVDGRLSTSVDASGGGGTTSPATLTHHYYSDGTQKSLDVASTALNQEGLFTYSYRPDGRVETEVIDDTDVGGIGSAGPTTLTYTYTSAGRITERDESGEAANSTPTKFSYYSTGQTMKETAPAIALSNYEYSAQGEVVQISGSGSVTYPYQYTLRGELILDTLMANGVAVQWSLPGPHQSFEYSWDDQMGVMLASSLLGCTSNCTPSSWSYGKSGQLTGEQGPYGPTDVETGATRCYDTENHILYTNGNCASLGTPGSIVNWGPNGHPITVTTNYVGYNNSSAETLHWDGDQLLFSTRKNNGQDTLDDIKVDSQGDILPNDTGYAGLTFYSRDASGTVMGCHHKGGAVFTGTLGESVWLQGWQYSKKDVGPCANTASVAMPVSTNWYATPLAGPDGPNLRVTNWRWRNTRYAAQ